jgi:hypothetical protein
MKYIFIYFFIDSNRITINFHLLYIFQSLCIHSEDRDKFVLSFPLFMI